MYVCIYTCMYLCVCVCSDFRKFVNFEAMLIKKKTYICIEPCIDKYTENIVCLCTA